MPAESGNMRSLGTFENVVCSFFKLISLKLLKNVKIDKNVIISSLRQSRSRN
jgi:hypothetical protein